MAKISQNLALIALSAFSGTLLFIAIAVVKFWQAVEPSVFLDWMTDHFFRFPMIMVPLNLISLLLVITALSTSWKAYPNSRIFLSLGLLSLFLCTITFPIYFAGANAELIAHSVNIVEVADKVKIWSNWHWLRTGLALLSVAFVSWGMWNSDKGATNLTSQSNQ